MSLITRCPACETMFKVVPDQLRISEGWVRCGQCSEIFNASQNLVAGAPVRTEAPTPPPPAPPQPAVQTGTAHQLPDTPAAAVPMPMPPPEPEPAFEPPEDRAGSLGRQQFEQKVWDLEPAAADTLPEAALPAISAQADPSHPGETQDAAAPAFSPVEPVWTPEPPAADERNVAGNTALQADAFGINTVPAQSEAHPRAGSSDTEDDPGPPFSFMQQARGTRFWERPPVRLALAVLALLLTGVLVGQVLVHERNRLVLLEPAARPVVEAACRLAGCEIGALRQIESVVIDSSSFGRLRADAYRLAFSLRNQAPVDIALPAIELSLTDTQDQAVIRRVILPAEYGASGTVLPAGADWNGALAMNIRPGAGTDRIAGYRLLAFYP